MFASSVRRLCLPVRLKPRVFENPVSNETGFFVFPPPPVIARDEAINRKFLEDVKLLAGKFILTTSNTTNHSLFCKSKFCSDLIVISIFHLDVETSSA